jgi:L-asparagine transporter-like permease
MDLLAAKVWTYWISWVLVGSGVLAAVATAIGYLVRVSSPKYPKR